MQRLRRSVCEQRSAPKSDLKWGGERMPGCQRLRQTGPRKRDSSTRTRQKSLCRCGRAYVILHLAGAYRQLRSSSPSTLGRATEGRGKVSGSRFFQGKHPLLASLKLIASLDTCTCLGRQDFPINQGGSLAPLERTNNTQDPSCSLLASEVQSNEVTVAWLMTFQN